MAVSLFDTAGMKVVTWWVVYHPRVPHFWFAKYLKQGFRHVELAKELRYGPEIADVAWIYVLPSFEMLDVEFTTDPRPPWVKCPTSTCQKVTAMRRLGAVRSWWDMGPPSCVEIVKTTLGLRSFWIRTPWQLYQYIQKRRGVISSEE